MLYPRSETVSYTSKQLLCYYLLIIRVRSGFKFFFLIETKHKRNSRVSISFSIWFTMTTPTHSQPHGLSAKYATLSATQQMAN